MELAITSIFDAVRWIVRKLLFMPEKQALPPWGVDGRHTGLLEDPEVKTHTHCVQHDLKSYTLLYTCKVS